MKQCRSCKKEYQPKRKNSVHCDSCLVGIRFNSTQYKCKKCGEDEWDCTIKRVARGICRKCEPRYVRPTPNPNRASNAVLTRFVNAGLIPPPGDFLCIDCGARATCWEHRDYNKPLDVEPTCQSCNSLRGAGIDLVAGGMLDTSRFTLFPKKCITARTVLAEAG